MARIPLLDRNHLTDADQAIYERLQVSRGVPTGNIWRALANAPPLLDRILSLADALRHDVTIEKRFRELAVLMVGVVAKSSYEFDHHWNAALKAGLARDKLQALADFETSALFDDAERAVLRYAKEITAAGEVGDATWDTLRAHFDDRQATEITVTIAWYNCVVRILLPLKIENEAWFRKL
jgi:alkylhydroperoxidase family enzyme